MNPTRTWMSRVVLLTASALIVTGGILAIYGSMRWWGQRGNANTLSIEDNGNVPVETLLSEEEAGRVRELVKSMMNPPESTEAAAQLRDHLEGLIQQKSPSAPLTMVLVVEYLVPRFASLDTSTRQISLAMLSDIFGWFGQNSTSCWPSLLSPSKNLLSSALSDSSADVTRAALEIVRASWEWSPPDVESPSHRKALGTWKSELHTRCLELLSSRDERIRATGGVTVVSVPIDAAASKGLVLLHDESPLVRRMILLALSDRTELMPSEDVISFLRDPHPAVRSTADIVLTSRGLTREQIALATRATDPSPLVRAQAPRFILESTAIDRVIWLIHLSRDREFSVRTEAARAMASIGDEDCLARLGEMAKSDPDTQVQQLVRELAQRVAQTNQANPAETLPPIKFPKAN